MKIQVGLLDESEIIKKMLSHCLHYFVVNIHSFKTWDECLLYTNNEKLSILFVDWDMLSGKNRLIDLVRENLSSIPAVLMYRQDSSDEISQKDSEFAPHRLTKPLNPKQVREIFSKLVPQINESSIHSFLRFPKDLSPPADQTSSGQDPKTQTTKTQQVPYEAMTQKTKQIFSTGPQANPSLEPAGSLEASSFSLQSKPSKKLDKSEIVLNEDTKNELAPMAIKSSNSKKDLDSIGSKAAEEHTLEVLKKYRDSLEFTKLMEKTLSDYAKEALCSLLEPEQTKSTLKESMKEFQEGEKFKKQVDQEIKILMEAYLKEELPLKIKSILQEEIKKILSD